MYDNFALCITDSNLRRAAWRCKGCLAKFELVTSPTEIDMNITHVTRCILASAVTWTCLPSAKRCMMSYGFKFGLTSCCLAMTNYWLKLTFASQAAIGAWSSW